MAASPPRRISAIKDFVDKMLNSFEIEISLYGGDPPTLSPLNLSTNIANS
jgi:hypothetical protein